MKKHIPNFLSSLRLLSPFVLTPLIVKGNYLWAMIALSILLLTDAFDGFLARRWNVQSSLGAKIDVVADKVILLSLLIPLIFVNLLFTVTLALEVIISITNIIRKLKGYDPKTLQIGRIKMLLISLFMGLNYLGIILDLPEIIIEILFGVTTLFQVVTEYSYLQELKLESQKQKIDDKYRKLIEKQEKTKN